MIITRKKFIGPLQQVRCGNLTLDFTDVAKSLGVLIDNRLTWDSHIKRLSKSFSAQLKMLKGMKYLPVNVPIRGYLFQNDSAKCNVLHISLG